MFNLKIFPSSEGNSEKNSKYKIIDNYYRKELIFC